jgi:glycosyltransferase involved in cell wall biosynthesis
MTAQTSPPTVGVVVASKGRPGVVALLVQSLLQQSVPPDAIVVSVSDPADAAGMPVGDTVTINVGRAGACAQRNAGIAALPPTIDIVVFFDDDFIPSRYWIERVRGIFAASSDVAVLTGLVLFDDIKGPGMSWPDGQAIVARADAAPTPAPFAVKESFSPYGCNMAFCRAALGELRFDERLVLYAWQEDTDLGARMAARGRMIWSDGVWGVHLGVKGGRNSGRKFGYSQMVNPYYMVGKGTMRAKRALRLASGNLVANTARSFFPEPYIDRLGRLQGNLLGLWDIVTGRWRPERAAEL